MRKKRIENCEFKSCKGIRDRQTGFLTFHKRKVIFIKFQKQVILIK